MTVNCESDVVFLCWACNTSIHGMSFFIAYHVCQVTYAVCHSLDVGNHVRDEFAPFILLAILILLPHFCTLWHPHPLALTSPSLNP
ncbi:hypothetical protein C4D60_Mb08t10900 [Musa balbisiana]|uniref:Uncharacterized protein n=1 Tax=Musa balbisiana TaxID=52838 RepID=A0A4S8K2V8_MUSBA|nr:hypothetical protein C4D60_Mb08t10900 [Musa balbisiana]